MKKEIIYNKGYVTYVNVNDWDYLDTESTVTVKFSEINDLDDLIQLLLNNGFNKIYNKVYSVKIGDNYYLNGYDRVIDIINQIIQKSKIF